ncbi:MAG: 8-amino-7-oxononanoate synthase, partial [Rhizobacter sp.]
TLNAVTRRFQNVRGPLSPDPLANMEVSPLRPLSNLLWGYIQDEQHRLTIMRRNAEYDHHYGLRLEGRALQGFQPADSRSGFLEAFHQLLRLCAVFYKQDDDTTVKADAFGVLNALKEVHLVLSQGAHGQFGDLPATARIEMLMQQWLLARPELREFLPSRAMVAYPAQWMHSVEAMKKLQGWTDTSVIHFHNLAVFGEQLLLAIRWGAWSTVFEPTQAFNFARVFRPQIQGYIHAYRAATGVELGAVTAEVAPDTTTVPAVLLQRRLAAQRRSA